MAKPAMAPGKAAFYGETVAGMLGSVQASGTYHSLASRGMWPWLAGFPVAFWLVSKMGTDREAIEASNNPGYAEAKKLAYMTEDARRYRAGVKAADDKIFEEFAFAKSEEFSKLSLDMKKVKQDAYAQELVDMRIKQAKESQLKWLALQEKKMEMKLENLNKAPFH